jgi:hypothetical protein
MDEQLTQKINEAAKDFSDCLGDSYQALTRRTASTQEQVAQLTQAFFEGVIEHLRAGSRQPGDGSGIGRPATAAVT